MNDFTYYYHYYCVFGSWLLDTTLWGVTRSNCFLFGDQIFWWRLLKHATFKGQNSTGEKLIISLLNAMPTYSQPILSAPSKILHYRSSTVLLPAATMERNTASHCASLPPPCTYYHSFASACADQLVSTIFSILAHARAAHLRMKKR